MKSLILWSVILVSTFVIFGAAFYFARDQIYEKKAAPQAEKLADTAKRMTTQETSTQRADSLKLVLNGLLKELEANVQENQQLELKLQDKQAEIERLATLNDTLEAQIERMKTTEIKVQDLTKTLGSMKTEVLRPILKDLPNKVLEILYDQARSRDKEKIFNAIPPDRASMILKDMTQNLN